MKQHAARVLLMMALAVAACAAYWVNLLGTQRQQLVFAEQQVQFRAVRLSDALAVQVSTLFSGLEYLGNSLVATYLIDPDSYFLLSVQTAMRTYPKESIIQISVANAQGDIVYSSLEGGASGMPVSIADRMHFRAHAGEAASDMHIGYPVFGRLSQRWTIPISWALRRDGQFLGVVVLSVSPDYISDYFREVFTYGQDVALLSYQDGTYLARSSLQAQTINGKVPSDRGFLQHPDQEAGQYQAAADVDHIARFYAWRRVAGFPLVVSIGLERARAMESLDREQHHSLVRNGIVTGVLMTGVLWGVLLNARLRRGRKLRQALFDNSAAEILLMRPMDRRIVMANQRAQNTFAPAGQALVGMPLSGLYASGDDQHHFESAFPALREHGKVQVEALLRNHAGEPRWFVANGTLLDRAAPNGEIIWTLLDITERRLIEQRLADARMRMLQVIAHFPGGVLVEDEHGVILVINQVLCNLLALGREAATLIGTPVEQLPDSLGPADRAVLQEVLPLVALQETGRGACELVYRDRVLAVNVTAVRRDGEDIGRLWTVTDITDRVRHETDLNRRATTDALTGLANRAAFLARLDMALALPAASGGRRGLLLMADLDHFKRVNDTYGHAAGDEVLRYLAGVFLSTLRKTDLVGRLGGEEFSVLLPGVSDAEGRELAERMRIALADSNIPTTAGVVRITISIGMARLDAGTVEEILAAADAALYTAKRNGRNRVEAAWEA